MRQQQQMHFAGKRKRGVRPTIGESMTLTEGPARSEVPVSAIALHPFLQKRVEVLPTITSPIENWKKRKEKKTGNRYRQ